MANGPYEGWLGYCEEARAVPVDDAKRSNILWTLGNVAQRAGFPVARLLLSRRRALSMCDLAQSGSSGDAAQCVWWSLAY